MITTIISHDLETATARIRFEHQDVTLEDNYNLRFVIPGTDYIFAQMGIDFLEEYQVKAIEKLEASIQAQIENGSITMPPVAEAPEYSPPPEPVEEPEE